MIGKTVRARAIRLFLGGWSMCEIADLLGRTTTPGSVRDHLLQAGLGGVVWCPVCRAFEQI